jgi:acetyltransferase
MVGFSQLVAEQRWIKEIDINPMFASAEDLVALDARVILHDPKTKEDKLPKLAIRPYPTQYVSQWKAKNGASLLLRPIRPEDEPLIVKFHATLSERSVYQRYFNQIKLDQRVAHERLVRICFNDYDREIALVAEHKNAETGQPEIIGVGRLSKARGLNEAEFALVISDDWQRQGLGTELLKQLIQVAQDEKLNRITGTVLADNHGMQHLIKKVGFKVKPAAGDNDVSAEYKL